MKTGHRRAVLSLLLLLGAGAAEVAGQKPSGTMPSTPGGPEFTGRVLIAGLPADPGTVVQVVVFRDAQNFKVCGDATVKVQTVGLTRPPPMPNLTGYDAAVDNIPECTNPDNSYDFFVNGVLATASVRYPFSPTNQLATVNLSVPELALKTASAQPGVRLMWFYGRVRDNFGRPAPAGTMVTAQARGASCTGTGTTQDLYWAPKASSKETVGVLGFYWIGIDLSPACQDRSILFDVYAGSKLLRASTANVSTPPYGRAMTVNVQMP